MQTAALSGEPQVWNTQRFAQRSGLGELGSTMEYNHTHEHTHAVKMDDAQLLGDYLAATTAALTAYIRTLTEADLNRVIYTSWNPHVTCRVRLARALLTTPRSMCGQAAYAARILTPAAHEWGRAGVKNTRAAPGGSRLAPNRPGLATVSSLKKNALTALARTTLSGEQLDAVEPVPLLCAHRHRARHARCP